MVLSCNNIINPLEQMKFLKGFLFDINDREKAAIW